MLFYAQLLVLIIVAIMHIWFGSLYLTVSWWDILTHFLAGLWTGLITASFLQRTGHKPSLITCASAALGLGFVWEFFELSITDAGSVFMGYWLDTAKDLMLDALGGAGAAFLSQRTGPAITHNA